MSLIEIALIATALAVACFRPVAERTISSRLGERVSFVAKRRALSVFLVRVLTLLLRAALLPIDPFPWHRKASPSFGRAAIKKQLRQQSCKHMVFAHYAPYHEPFAEWVYSESALKTARIVWAREKERTSNQQLIDTLPDQSVRSLNADPMSPQLIRSPTRDTHGP
jgi:hypothetical protein